VVNFSRGVNFILIPQEDSRSYQRRRLTVRLPASAVPSRWIAE